MAPPEWQIMRSKIAAYVRPSFPKHQPGLCLLVRFMLCFRSTTARQSGNGRMCSLIVALNFYILSKTKGIFAAITSICSRCREIAYSAK